MAQLENTNATTHGAFSERQIRSLARNHRRRVLRQIGLRSADLSPIGKGYLDAYIALRAKVDLIDAHISEHGLLREDGEPQPALKLYVALQNSARLALTRLEAHVRARQSDPVVDLHSYLEAKRERLDDAS